MNTKINIDAAFANISDHFSPKIIDEVNDVYIKLVKILGDKVPWHSHTNEDELFYILEGSLQMELEGEAPIQMNKGDMFVVKKGTIHRVSSLDECHIMLIENKTTAHTGDIIGEITKSIEEQK